LKHLKGCGKIRYAAIKTTKEDLIGEIVKIFDDKCDALKYARKRSNITIVCEPFE
jgi:hypothetical protein